LGKTLLAHQSKDELSRIIKEIKLKPFTKNTITSKRRLVEELKVTSEKGYALDKREYEENVECIGAPIRNHLGDVIAALSISGPQRKINTPKEKQYIDQVIKATSLISSKMGYKNEPQ
jgi:DNA-binding IclR family transcriptional regulator